MILIKELKLELLRFCQKKKIKVKIGLLAKEAKNFYKSYRINRLEKIPYITGKIAVSKNNLIYSSKSKKITDQTSDKLTHYLRYKNDAILISSKTLNVDNPKLNCRIKGYEKFSPKRIILDKNLDIKLNTYVFNTIRKNNTIIFHNSSKKNKINILEKRGINLIKSKLDNKKYFDFKKIFQKLHKLGVRYLLVEGGNKITQNLIKRRLFNQFYLFKSPKDLSKGNKYQIFTSFNLLNKKYDNIKKVSSKLAKDKITIYKR